MKHKSLLILVNGLAVSGKSILAKRLSGELGVPYFSKDDFKTILLTELGTGEVKWIKRLGKISGDIFRLIILRMVESGKPVIIDARFFSEIISPYLDELKRDYDFDVICITCKCDTEVASKRFVQRLENDEGRLGFREELLYEEFKKDYLEGIEPIKVDGLKLDYDSTDFSTTEEQIRKILAEIRKYWDGSDFRR